MTLRADTQPIVTSPAAVGGTVEREPDDTMNVVNGGGVGKIAGAPLAGRTEAGGAIPVPVAMRTASPRFVCRGTAPFWTLKIENSHMDFEQTVVGSTRFSAPQASPSENSDLAVTSFSGTAQDGSNLSALVVNARLNGGVACTDDMSDQTYEYSVFLNRTGRIFDGCCWIERGN